MIPKLQRLKFRKEELEKMEDQQIEMDALSKVDKRLEQLETNSVWKSKPLKIIQKITIFITRLKHSSTTYKFKLLKKNIFLLIRDKASSFQYYLNRFMLFQKPTRFSQIKYEAQATNPLWWRFWCFLKSDRTVFLPADKFLFVWDLLMMLVTIVNIFYVPLQLSFDLNEDSLGSVFTLFSTLPSCIFLLDLILTFFKGYYDNGILQRNKTKIMWHYLKGDFMLDLAIVLPFILSWFGYSAANYLMLIRMTRVRRTMIVIEEISNFKEKSAVIYQLFCLIYSLLLISHFCACLFHYFALFEVDMGYSHTWLHQQGIYDSDVFTKYFTSLYWITITSMTVGYGDIVPVTVPEKILVTVITFLVTGVFGYALGMIQSIFYKMAEQTNVNNSRLRLVSNHIKQRGLNTQLQFRVRKYIEYYLQFKQDEELDLDELMGQLNPKLKQEVQIAMYYRYLKHSKLFGENFSDDLIKKLCFCIHEKTFAPEEVIIKKEEYPNQLYIVLSGQVKSILLEKTIKRYKQGHLICEREFFYQDKMQYNIVAQSFVQVAFLNLSEFQQIMHVHRESFEQYRFAIDNTIFGENTNLIICEACQSHHQFKNCPLVFFKKNNGKVLAAYHNNQEQPRSSYQRRKKKSKVKQLDILNGAYDHMIKMKTSLGLQIDPQFLSKIGFQEYQEEAEEQGSMASPIARRPSFEQQDDNRVFTQQTQHTLPNEDTFTQCEIDKVYEYEYFYPNDNISKISKLINKQQLVNKIMGQIKNKKSIFANLVFREVLQKIM